MIISVSNAGRDDFARHHATLTASAHGKTVSWTIPDRLVENVDLFNGIVRELLAELDD